MLRCLQAPKNRRSASSTSARCHLVLERIRPLPSRFDPKYLSIFEESRSAWTLLPGTYTIMLGGCSQDLPLKVVVDLN